MVSVIWNVQKRFEYSKIVIETVRNAREKFRDVLKRVLQCVWTSWFPFETCFEQLLTFPQKSVLNLTLQKTRERLFKRGVCMCVGVQTVIYGIRFQREKRIFLGLDYYSVEVSLLLTYLPTYVDIDRNKKIDSFYYAWQKREKECYYQYFKKFRKKYKYITLDNFW
eukprot:TRINITY_DN13953_c1_g1_i1.p2 TRINITY_DN13953_c1_g1~~TRINITY_DN13953_c1_g1_i1.p2  ORF type:complete len:166 (-),score=9.07 TRINITY_DN13953_c1_g1_i1:43-540(-)